MVDTRDLKSLGLQGPCGFESRPGHMDPKAATLNRSFQRTRIAPTPSGLLHLGNGASFLLTATMAREYGAELMLRIDDLDAERVRPEYITDIFETLEWLGIRWTIGPCDPADHRRNWSQSLRSPDHDRLLDELRSGGHLYACTCSRPKLKGCDCRALGVDLDAPEASWRLRVPERCPVTIQEWGSGPRVLDLARLLPDPVLRQRGLNGQRPRPAYQVASLSDDLHFGIDLVVRGEDLLPSTACQVYMATLLGRAAFAEATFVHHALIGDERGGKLSKSRGAGSLREWRQAGEGPELVHGSMMRLRA